MCVSEYNVKWYHNNIKTAWVYKCNAAENDKNKVYYDR